MGTGRRRGREEEFQAEGEGKRRERGEEGNRVERGEEGKRGKEMRRDDIPCVPKNHGERRWQVKEGTMGVEYRLSDMRA